MTPDERVAALSRIVHTACVYVDGEAALQHQPEDHDNAIRWALNRAWPADLAALREEADDDADLGAMLRQAIAATPTSTSLVLRHAAWGTTVGYEAHPKPRRPTWSVGYEWSDPHGGTSRIGPKESDELARLNDALSSLADRPTGERR